MTSAQPAEVCRISVFGPNGRADLAVPLSVTVSSLLPVLLQRTTDAPPARHDGGWVLQRLGDAPLDPSGTPESLEWRDGDELYLRPAADPLPELDFDDIADGMATAVNRHPGRWKPAFNRWLFLGFSVAALLVLAWALLGMTSRATSALGATVAAVALLIASIAAGVRTEDRVLINLLGLGGIGFAALAGAFAPSGPAAAADLQGTPLLAGGLAVAFAALILIGARVAWAPAMPYVTFGVAGVTGALAALTQWLHHDFLLTPQQVAGSVSVFLLAVLIFTPRMAIRLARIRGPQMPWTAEQLQEGVEAVPAREVTERTAYADGYLTIVTIASAVVLSFSFPFLVGDDFFPVALASAIAAAVLLRARAFLGAWQRVSLAAAGGLGVAMIGLSIFRELTPQYQGVGLAVMALAFFVLLLAMLRPPSRRLLPIWGHLANGLETLSAVAAVPLLLQLFGVYGAGRGLVG